MQTKCIKVENTAHAAERQALSMFVPVYVFTAVRQQAAAAFHGSPRWRLQWRERQDRRHGRKLALEILANGARRQRLVERIEVDPRRAALEKVATLTNCVFDTHFVNRLLVVAHAI